MKQSLKLSASLLVGAASLMTATPAFAQTYEYGSSGDAAAGGIVCAVYACTMIPALLLGVLQIWMLIDAIMRQEYEFPNSSGNSKLIWILLLVFLGGSSIFYYFMVFKKIKRGSMTPPSGGGYVPPQGGYQPPPGNYPPPPGAGTPPPPPPAPPAQ